MQKTYSERRAAILFRASRDMRRIAVDVLDDCTNPAELTGRSAAWCKNQAKITAERANELESEGHAQGIATARQNTDLFQSRREYEQAIDRFEARLREHGVDPATVKA